MPRRWTGKWFQNSSGAHVSRQGRGRGQSRGLRTQAPVPTLPVRSVQPKAAGAQPSQATGQPQRQRRKRTRKQGRK